MTSDQPTEQETVPAVICKYCKSEMNPGATKCDKCREHQRILRRLAGDLNVPAVLALVGTTIGIVFGYFQIQNLIQGQANIRAVQRETKGEVNENVKDLNDRIDAIAQNEITFELEPIISDNGVYLNRDQLARFVNEFVSSTPSRRERLRIDVPEPKLAVELKRFPSERAKVPDIPQEEFEYLSRSLDSYRNIDLVVVATLNELVPRSIELLGSSPESIPKPEVQAIMTDPDKIMDLLRYYGERNITNIDLRQIIQDVCQQYYSFRAEQSLGILLQANKPESLELYNIDVPEWLTAGLHKRFKERVLEIYRKDHPSHDLNKDDMIEIEFDGPDVTLTRLWVPKMYAPRIVVEHVEARPYTGPLFSAEKYFSRRFWAVHAVWQILAREQGLANFEMGWYPKQYTQFGLP